MHANEFGTTHFADGSNFLHDPGSTQQNQGTHHRQNSHSGDINFSYYYPSFQENAKDNELVMDNNFDSTQNIILDDNIGEPLQNKPFLNNETIMDNTWDAPTIIIQLHPDEPPQAEPPPAEPPPW